MRKQSENTFHKKFRLLNSQEYNDDIKWSSSSSSEYENTSYGKLCSIEKSNNRKRKRKRNVSKHVSNLDITIIDSCKNLKSDVVLEKSPILKSKRVLNTVSPILSSKIVPVVNYRTTSPILCTKNCQPRNPIVELPTPLHNSERVRKKLSYDKKSKKELADNNTCVNQDSNSVRQEHELNIIKGDNITLKSESNSFNTSDSSLKAKLVERVKMFFDSNFSSESTSQNISDTPTGTDNSTNENMDILSCKTPPPTSCSKSITEKLENSNNSDTSSVDVNTKKMKYKKGGLAFRLNALLKKQNAHLNLWQHERFLAVNSNFVIPKEENMMFRIQKIELKYGCYLINAIDMSSTRYYILINKKYCNINLAIESIFKLYEPYTVLPLGKDFKIVIDVCKFECIAIKC